MHGVAAIEEAREHLRVAQATRKVRRRLVVLQDRRDAYHRNYRRRLPSFPQTQCPAQVSSHRQGDPPCDRYKKSPCYVPESMGQFCDGWPPLSYMTDATSMHMHARNTTTRSITKMYTLFHPTVLSSKWRMCAGTSSRNSELRKPCDF